MTRWTMCLPGMALLLATAAQAQTCGACRAIANRAELMKICGMDPKLPEDRKIYLAAPWDLRLATVMRCDTKNRTAVIDRALWSEMDKCLAKFAGSNTCP